MKAKLHSAWLLLVLLSIAPALTLAQPASTTLTGLIDDDTPFVAVPLAVAADDTTLKIDIDKTSGDLDTLLYLVDPNGTIVAENDDRARGVYDSSIEFPRATAGQYTVIATRYNVADGSSSGEFRLVIEQIEETAQNTLNYDISDEALAAAGFPQIEPRPRAEWTVIAYYGADTNLEPGIINDFNEFEIAGGSSEDVRLVMLMDRHPEYYNAPEDDWADARIFEIGPDHSADHEVTFPPTIDSTSLASLSAIELEDEDATDDIDTGNGQTLAQYLVWAIRHFPADHYAVTFASHGAGWKGVITDYTNDHSIVTVPQLRQAFEIATQEAGVERFDLLINDACNMSSIEYFAGVADYFTYSLASPEIVVDPAMDMTLFTETLNTDPDVDLRTLGRELVNKYVEQDMLLTGGDDAVFLTNAVTDLTAFNPVTRSVERFARLFNTNPARYATVLGEARANAYTYSRFLGGRSVVDLGSLMRGVQREARDSRLIDAAQDVLDALDGALYHGDGGARVQNSVSYYNIFFPDRSAEFYRVQETYFDQTTLPQWGQMLRNYYNAVTPQIWTGAGLDVPFHAPVAPDIKITNVLQGADSAANILRPVIIRADIVSRSLSYVDSTIDLLADDGTVVRLSNERVLTATEVDGETQLLNIYRPGVDQDVIIWDGALTQVSDGTNANFELVEFTETTGFMDAVYREPGSDTFNEVSIVFSRENGTVDRVINRAQDSEALAVISIPEGSEVTSFRYVVSPDGRVTQEPGNTYTWPAGGMTFSFEPAPNGTYEVGLLATAFGGTTDHDVTQVQIDNTDVDVRMRGGITATTLGYSTVRENEASRITFTRDAYQNVLQRSTRNDGLRNVSIYYVREGDPAGYTRAEPPSSLEEAANTMIDLYRLEPTSDFIPSTLDGRPALEFDYRRVTEDETYIGRIVITFSEPNPILLLAVGFATEAVEGVTDVDDIFPVVREFSRIYNADDLLASDTSEWVYNEPYENVNLPVQAAWDVAEVDGWVRYGPADASLPFVAVGRFDGLTPRDLLSQFVESGVQDAVIDLERAYNAQNNEWEALVYEAVRAGQPVLGRIYTTTVADATYAVWVEATDDDTAAETYSSVLEPIVDGIEIEAPASE